MTVKEFFPLQDYFLVDCTDLAGVRRLLVYSEDKYHVVDSLELLNDDKVILVDTKNFLSLENKDVMVITNRNQTRVAITYELSSRSIEVIDADKLNSNSEGLELEVQSAQLSKRYKVRIVP
jgi:hypothetical protein